MGESTGEIDLPVTSNTKDILQIMPENAGPHEFLKFLQEKVSVNALLQDRKGQATLDRLLSGKFKRKPNKYSLHSESYDFEKDERPENPNPILELENPGGTSYEYEAFKLQDNNHYYFFSMGWPSNPLFLRPQDIVGSGVFTPTWPEEQREAALKDLRITEEQFDELAYNLDPRIEPYRRDEEIPFTKPIERVSCNGGAVELYNYNTGRWETTEKKWKGNKSKVNRIITNLTQTLRSPKKSTDQQTLPTSEIKQLKSKD